MPRYAIPGLGVTSQVIIPGTSAEKLAWEALELALRDSGLERSQVNGYLYQPGFGERTSGMAASRASLGTNSTLQIDSSGASGIFALMAAIGLIEAGTAEYVMCVHATNARSQRCGADARALTWTPASGRGTVRTFVVFDKPYHPYFKERTPYVVAVVALEEGPEITTNVVDTDVTNVAIGMPVRIIIGERGGYNIHQVSARV